MAEIHLPTKATQDSIKQDTTALLNKPTGNPSKLFNQPGAYTWKVPKGIEVVYISGAGAGGGGGGGSSAWNSTSGKHGLPGRQGEMTYRTGVVVKGRDEILITIGEGGKKGLGSKSSELTAESSHKPGSSGTAGGATSLGDIITLSGGAGGGRSATNGDYDATPVSPTFYHKLMDNGEGFFFDAIPGAGTKGSGSGVYPGVDATPSFGYGVGGAPGTSAYSWTGPLTPQSGGDGAPGMPGILLIEW